MISRMPKWVGDWLESAAGPRLTVLEAAYITPTIKKIRFQGDISKMNFLIGGASVIRVSDTDYRNYTVVCQDIEKGILEIIFHIHGNGVGSRYIDTLKTSDELYISSPRGRAPYDPKVKRYLIYGDETSLGLACSLLPFLKKNEHHFHFYFELDEANKNAPRLLGLENFTAFPKNGLFNNEKWIKDLPVFQVAGWQAANFVLTGNATSVQTFRKVLKNATIGKVIAQGYWLEGKKGL
ncbi:FAD-binding oxidoreductase [Mucilaginibacter lappiensis]|uniref:NADPH-dependent ferric siderophore reductase n=1 Tax=Mucilaginibacter lappiensis TaxID=354630 RepID=A0A841JI61_9SPHI|nr:FAD-binding oxidoreductase [Mucilaginibacter lappiensis]MBB6130620.1 NADPH-dependent ferric siderophore reductase [Mucilaginibacter lappiensis]